MSGMASHAGWAAGTNMAERIRAHDWAHTPLGPMDAWPQSLRTAVDICLGLPAPGFVWWGSDLVQIHNDPARALFAATDALGLPARQAWSGAWPALEPVVGKVMSTGAALSQQVAAPSGAGTDLTLRCSALRNASDGITGLFVTIDETAMAQAGRDSELRLAEEGRRCAALLAECQHRVRNTLAVVRSIARRTAETSETAEACAMHLDGRLSAFGRVQAAMTRNPAAGVDLEILIADELLAVAAQEGEQVTHIRGPRLRLQPKAAETLALAFHELATNAVKFGALSTPRGRIAVEWRKEGTPDPRLVVDWTERGVSLSGEAPARRGFGVDLLQRALVYDLGAQATWSLEPTGLRCTIVLPLTDDIAAKW